MQKLYLLNYRVKTPMVLKLLGPSLPPKYCDASSLRPLGIDAYDYVYAANIWLLQRMIGYYREQ